MPYKIKSTKHKTLWTVQVRRKNGRKQEGQGWQTVVDSQGPLILPTRKVASNISQEYRNTNKNNIFRVAKIVVP